MRAFISWSGGKDCTLALNSFISTPGNEATSLVNFCEANGERSLSHGLAVELLKSQSAKLDIPIICQPIPENSRYEEQLKLVIKHLKQDGVTAGVFGDIYLQEHRIWIERVCMEPGITPVFPLWGRDTAELINEFIKLQFRAIVVSVNLDERIRPFAGTDLNMEMIQKLSHMEGIDPCGENGEYHTFVYDGPLFSHPVQFESDKQYYSNNYLFQSIRL